MTSNNRCFHPIFLVQGKTLLLFILLMCFSLTSTAIVKAETPDEWVRLGQRVHGGFGTYVALGIRIGLDAMKRLEANPRDLDVTYQNSLASPCPCVVDGIMIATVATPRQNSLRVLPTNSNSNFFGVALIKHRKTGQSLRYTIPVAARSLLDSWNNQQQGRERYDTVMNASQNSLFHVEMLTKKRLEVRD